MKSGEKIFRQMKQNSARVVHPTRRDFREAPTPWANGKDSVDFPCDEFLEIPFTKLSEIAHIKFRILDNMASSLSLLFEIIISHF